MLQDIRPDARRAESQESLALTGQPLAGLGVQCAVYAHPGNPDLLVKVPRDPVEMGEPWYKRFRSRHAPAVRELAEYQSLAARAPADLDLIERAVGFVDTDLGRGLAVVALRGPDGGLAPSLLQLAQARKIDTALRRELGRFLNRIIDSPLVAHDLKARNIVLAHDRETGTDRFVLVDGIGPRPDLPQEGLVRWLDRLNKKRRARKLMTEIETLTADANA